MVVRLSQPRRQTAAELGGVDGQPDQLLLDPATGLVVHACRVSTDDADEVTELDRGLGVRRLSNLVAQLVYRLDHDPSQRLYVRRAGRVLEAVVERRRARHGG